MSVYSFAGNATATQVLAAVSVAAGTNTYPAIDLVDYDADLLLVQNKGAGTGTLDGVVQDSADGSTDWVTVTALQFAQAGTAADLQTLRIPKKAVRRFIRYRAVVVTGPQLLAVSLIGVKRRV